MVVNKNIYDENMLTVGDIIQTLEKAYPPELAQSWDKVGLICGDPQDSVHTVVVAVDCTDAVVDAALKAHAQMIIVHHPLLLRGVSSVAADTPKGRIIHRLIRKGIALYSAHTNADSARPGVNDKLAEVLGVTPGAALAPQERGNVDPQKSVGIGRIGTLDEPMTFREFVRRVSERLPRTQWGIRAAGDPEKMIRTVAVASGAGDSFLDSVTGLGADCFVTSDLRHHPVDEHLRSGGCPVIDTAHWASEFPWCEQVKELLDAEFSTEDEKNFLQVRVLPIVTDPWTLHRS